MPRWPSRSRAWRARLRYQGGRRGAGRLGRPALLTSMHSEWSMASDWEGIPHCKTMRSVWSTRTKQTAQTAVREFTPTDLTFQLPVRRLGVSGGTAPFFGLQLSEPLAEGRSLEHYIGKDLSHARDEVSFYEQARSLLQGPAHARRGLQPLLSFLLDYAGVASCPVEGAHPNEAPNDLLVMRNMRDGCKKLRMLDIKIGEKTASAGWQGKSRMAALKQDCLDVLTNSKGEGFRLEGFDGPPPVLRSMDPLLDLLKLHAPKEDVKKKAFRFMLQRMPAAEVFMHLVDVHQEPRDMSEEDLETLRAPTEAAELVLHEICSRLAKLALACRQCPAPQKWVGSSVALGFEAGGLPGRKVPEAQVREQVRVNLFDWGRSEPPFLMPPPSPGKTVWRPEALEGVNRGDRPGGIRTERDHHGVLTQRRTRIQHTLAVQSLLWVRPPDPVHEQHTWALSMTASDRSRLCECASTELMRP
mmetsp:Transcript_28088/g.93301  ORF Transcript_28088/g.93301 Transcript_28088/m.93301 type:complete len:471 (+) Transcript_28088:855-2267(+)